MTNPNDLQNMIGRTAVDKDGDKIGKIGQVYLDDQSGQPLWVTLSTGLFGHKENFAPLAGSSWDGDNLVLAVTKDQVSGAPSVDADGHTSDEENAALHTYYRGSFQTGDDQVAYSDDDGRGDTVGQDSVGQSNDDAMTRSEERLRVGTEQVESGRARLRKYVVTEEVTTTVPVSHEEVRVEREPITDDNRDQAMSGEEITEGEHEVVLHAEQPVVEKETVPVERVRLTTDTVTEDQAVTEQVRKEQIDEPATSGR